MRHETESILIAVGLAVVALCSLVVVWKVTKSLVRLLFWLAALIVLAAGAWWLLERYGIVPPLPLPG